jgi:hypothetical protein
MPHGARYDRAIAFNPWRRSMRGFQRGVAALVSACLLATGFAQAAPASLIGTEEVAAQSATPAGSVDHARLHAALGRADLAAALQARGVPVGAVRERVDALTDAEAAQLMAQIDQAPAGGDVLGLLFTVFIILLVTDILGLTKVFPFTRPVR